MNNPIIENIRKSLGRTAPSSTGMRPAIYKPRLPESPDSEVERFLGEIEKLSGVGLSINPTDMESALKSLVTEQIIRKATVWNTARLQQLRITTILSSLDVELVPPNAGKHEMAQCDLGITEADYLLPETGSIILSSSTERPRAVSLLPRVHLAIVSPEMLYPDMHQIFAEAKDRNYLVFITGPSRTADIELTTTLGVHGPKDLYVWMMGD